jgi:hypothetical protein
MRNFHRDFEALNEAYNNSIHQKQPHEIIHESVSSDIDNMYRESSKKQLREALKKIADVHTKDQSSLTYEDCMNEMKMYAEEQMKPVVPTAAPVDPLHNTPVTGLANEESKPDYIDADGDGDKEEPMKQALKDKENKDNTTEEATHDETEDDEDSETVEEVHMTFEEQLAFIKQLEEEDHDEETEDDTQEEAAGGASTLGGVAGKKDAAFQKGLDAAFDIQAKVSSERNPIKRAAMSKDAKKIASGVDGYMQALTGKLTDMTNALKEK